MAKSRKQKTAARKAKKAKEQALIIEAKHGSKKAAKKALKQSGLTKTYAEAERILERAYKGDIAAGRMLKQTGLTKTYSDAERVMARIEKGNRQTKQILKTYEKERKKRQARAETTNRKRAATAAKDHLFKDILGHDTEGKFIRQSLQEHPKDVRRIYEDGVIQLGNKNDGMYVKLIGELDRFSPSATPDPNQKTAIYTFKLAADRVATREGLKLRHRPGFENWDRLTPNQREDLLKQEFEHITRGNGRLKAFYFADTTGFGKGEGK